MKKLENTLKSLPLEKKVELVIFHLTYDVPIILDDDIEFNFLDEFINDIKNDVADRGYRLREEDCDSPLEWLEGVSEFVQKNTFTNNYRNYLNESFKVYN